MKLDAIHYYVLLFLIGGSYHIFPFMNIGHQSATLFWKSTFLQNPNLTHLRHIIRLFNYMDQVFWIELVITASGYIMDLILCRVFFYPSFGLKSNIYDWHWSRKPHTDVLVWFRFFSYFHFQTVSYPQKERRIDFYHFKTTFWSSLESSHHPFLDLKSYAFPQSFPTYLFPLILSFMPLLEPFHNAWQSPIKMHFSWLMDFLLCSVTHTDSFLVSEDLAAASC